MRLTLNIIRLLSLFALLAAPFHGTMARAADAREHKCCHAKKAQSGETVQQVEESGKKCCDCCEEGCDCCNGGECTCGEDCGCCNGGSCAQGSCCGGDCSCCQGGECACENCGCCNGGCGEGGCKPEEKQ